MPPREFLGSWDKNANIVETQKFCTSGVGLQEGKDSRTKLDNNLGGFKKALRGFSAEAPKPDSGPVSGRLGSDFGGLPGCNSDFWSVTPTFGL